MSERVFIDVREPYEFAKGHISGAINIPPTELMAGSPQLSDMPTDTELVLYCISGARSGASKIFLEDQGFTRVINGINEDHVRARYE